MVLECRDDSLNNNGGGGVCGDVVGGPHLSVSLCCIWEQPAPVAAASPPPPPPVTVRRPPGRSKRTLADRASWAGFSARGRSHVLMGTQMLPHHINAREFLPAGVATSTPIRPKSFAAAPTDSEDWLDPPVGQTPHQTAFAMDVRKHGRRRSRDSSGGRQTQLRSPMVQRPSASKVTLQGWLFKQGSEGLMLWKRRWFVLSEYCLFYYKDVAGPEEEKLLGSILLPSYKISPCAPDDRVFRKFSFKAEHHNMRTYFFAADSRETMVRWMNAMSLASILQSAVPTWEEPASSRPSVSSVSQSADDSDSGFHGYRSPRGGTTPRQGGDGASAKDSVETNGWGPPAVQPLYANAPPKPKRLPQGDSPDPSPERPRQTPTAQQPTPQQPTPQQLTPQQLLTPQHPIYGVSPRYVRPPSTVLDYEDVYGRKGQWPPPPPQAYMNEPPKVDNFKAASSPPENNNYVKPPPDVTKTYVKPPGPPRPTDVPTKQPPPATLPKQPFRMTSPAPPPAVKPRPKPPAGHPPRPHSADFLEKDSREMPTGGGVHRRGRNSAHGERPKSSIDMHNDEFWSEESYAQKMRQSLYMHAHQAQPGRATPLQRHFHDARAKIPSGGRNSSAGNHESRPAAEEQQAPGSARRSSSNEQTPDKHSREFMRSASARLPRQKHRNSEFHEQQLETPGSEKKIQQREESMQRLLEWKQRMLQSPLTRKTSPRPNDGSMPHSPLSHLMLRTPDGPATPGSDAGSVSFRPRRQPNRGPSSSTSSRSRSQDPGRRSAPPIHRRNSYSSDDEGSGSGSIQDSIPAVRSHRQQSRPPPMSMQPPPAAIMTQEDMGGGGPGAFKVGAGLGSRGASPMLNSALSPLPAGLAHGPDEGISDAERHRRSAPKIGNTPANSNGNSITVSAGDLLGRSHEELVLLLIQLRRESAALKHAAELCRADVLSQARLAELDSVRRAEHLRRLEELKRHLQEIEKQYEKGKPLVHLVDNMVRLGSLYKGSSMQSLPRNSSMTPPPMNRLEFIQMQEQRLLAEERNWNRFGSPEHEELQAKVQQLYRLDIFLQEESLNMQTLQQDKALLQRALGGLRHKIANSTGAEAERYRHQERLLERELNRVCHMLAANAQKLEETVAENTRLEHELLMLRQKVQAQRRLDRSASPAALGNGGSSVALEMELRRVQSLVGDLQRQRHDLSNQVKQLTEKRHSLTQRSPNEDHLGRSRMRSAPSPNLSTSLPNTPRQRRPSSSWLETDLDSMHTEDVSVRVDDSPSPLGRDFRAPLYVNTEALDYSPNGKESLTPDDLSPPPPPAPDDPSLYNGSATQYYEPQDISEADDRMKRFYGIIPRTEKAEIKTVRIVKRESERRNRVKQRPSMELDLGRLTEESHPPPPTELELSLLMELQAQQEQQLADAHNFQRSLSLPRGFGKQPPPPPMRTLSPRSDSDSVRAYRTMSPDEQRPMSAHAQLFGSTTDDDSPRLLTDEGVCEGSSSSGPVSPVYQSEAARAIVQEMTRRRAVPKTKRRHHTVAGGAQQHNNNVAANMMVSGARARDDLDMERALRRRVAGAPDVVRSTLSQKELKYNETTIDNLLGTPNKIVIPERYVPEMEPEKSAEEQLQRLRKAESIRKMLSETSPLSTNEGQPQSPNHESKGDEVNSTMKLKLAAEKKQRDHLLQLNQILAQQVMEKSKRVAGSSGQR